MSREKPDLENDLPVNETIAQVVYDELGHQVDKVDEVLSQYEKTGLEHTASYETLRERGACFRTMRGVLQDMGDWDLR